MLNKKAPGPVNIGADAGLLANSPPHCTMLTAQPTDHAMNLPPVYRTLLLAALCLGLASHTQAAKPGLLLLSDIYCPYTCTPGSDAEGYLVELLHQAGGPAGIELQYAVYPWERALLWVAKGQADGLLGVSARRAPGMLLSSVVGFDRTALTSLTPIAPPAQDSAGYQWLDRYKLGLIPFKFKAESDYEHYLVQRRAQAPDSMVQMHGENAANLLARLLVAGRVDAVLENPQVMQYLLHHQFPDRPYWQVNLSESRALHIALRDTPENKAWLAVFDRELARMRADGRLRALLARYGLTDWQTPTP